MLNSQFMAIDNDKIQGNNMLGLMCGVYKLNIMFEYMVILKNGLCDSTIVCLYSVYITLYIHGLFFM